MSYIKAVAYGNLFSLNLTAKNKIENYALQYGNVSFQRNWSLVHLVFKIAKFICIQDDD
jgi:hypothetical protein